MFNCAKRLSGIVFLLFVFQLKVAFAATASVSGVPTAWRVESYGEKLVVLWNTSSKCANGQINLPSTATAVEHSRLYATIMAAKISQAQIFIYYDDSTPNCTIISYGFN